MSEFEMRARIKTLNQLIHGLECERDEIEYQLQREKFHYEHIDEKYRNLNDIASGNLILLLIFSIIEIGCLVGFVVGLLKKSAYSCLGLGLIFVYCFSPLKRLVDNQIEAHKSVRFHANFRDKDRTNTMLLRQKEKKEAEAKVKELTRNLDKINEELLSFQNEKSQIEDKIGKQDFWSAKEREGNKADSLTNANTIKSGLSINNREISPIGEDYNKDCEREIRRLQMDIEDLENEKKNIYLKQERMDARFFYAKNRIMFWTIVILAAITFSIVTQSFRILSLLFSLVGIVCSVFFLIKLKNEYLEYVITYYVDHEKPIMEGYAFQNSITVTRKKIEEVDMKLYLKKMQLERVKKRNVQ